MNKIKEKLKLLPASPGVYVMRSREAAQRRAASVGDRQMRSHIMASVGDRQMRSREEAERRETSVEHTSGQIQAQCVSGAPAGRYSVSATDSREEASVGDSQMKSCEMPVSGADKAGEICGRAGGEESEAAEGSAFAGSAAGEIIYIGKAKNLKNRVSSYFKGARLSAADARLFATPQDNKVTAMISHVTDFEWFVVDTEDDALFLEASLIYKHKPRYNILLRDDRRFPYIRINRNKIEVVRDTKGEGRHFGPYFNGIYAGSLMDIIRTVFNNDAEAAAEFLEGKRGEVAEILTARMQKASEMQQFELAIAYRNALRSVNKLQRQSRVMQTADDADAFSLGACRELGGILGLDKTPRKIECFDISHTAGERQTASMAVFIDGAAEKSLYRKFKIRHGQGNNDFLSMSEVIVRRLRHKEWEYPDIMVIDGGKGQLGAAKKAVSAAGGRSGGFNGSVISLAKRFEEIYVNEDEAPILLPRHSYALRLLQRLRDEAHRFAITFHRKLRDRI